MQKMLCTLNKQTFSVTMYGIVKIDTIAGKQFAEQT